MANETVVCTYRVRPDEEEHFRTLLAGHWGTLHRLGFVTDQASTVLRSTDGPPTYLEIFTWQDGGFARAHEHPDVLTVWEAMDPLLQEREGQPKWEFPHYHEVTLRT